MPTILPIDKATSDANKTTATLDAVKAKLGMVPNLFATFAHAPVVLNAYLQFSETLGQGRLTARQREIIALALAQEGSCQYCLSAHTLIGKGAGLSEDDIAKARRATATAPLDAAIAKLARHVVMLRGQVKSEEVVAARKAGIDDGLIMEIIGNVALNLLTNYANHIANTDVDFPRVEL